MTNPILTSDGQLLSVKLKKAESHKRRTAFLLVLPLFLFVVVTYLLPIGSLMVKSIDNRELFSFLVNTNESIHEWDGIGLPDETVYTAFYKDLTLAVANKKQGKIATRLNYEQSGYSSLIKKTSRKLKKFTEGEYKAQFIKADKRWGNTEYLLALQKATVAFHGRKYLTTFDLNVNSDGDIVQIPEKKRINVTLWPQGYVNAFFFRNLYNVTIRVNIKIECRKIFTAMKSYRCFLQSQQIFSVPPTFIRFDKLGFVLTFGEFL